MTNLWQKAADDRTRYEQAHSIEEPEKKAKTFLVAVYDCDQAYGGPEEGGWWYDRGSLVRIVRLFKSEDKASNFCRRLNKKLDSRLYGPNQGKREYTSVLSNGEYRAMVFEDIAPAGFPDRRPHYE